MGTDAVSIMHDGAHATAVTVRSADGKEETIHTDYIFSTTDIKALGHILSPAPPSDITAITDKLEYRDFLTVGILLETKPIEKDGAPLTDTWMYIHEPGVSVGRAQLFHNWSPAMVADPAHGWVGLEYFCAEGDPLWNRSDEDLIALAGDELEKVGLRRGIPVIGGMVIRQPKAYPGYFGAYEHFPKVRDYLKTFDNLYPIGRNGMHRYNNQDHSMLAAMTAVDLISTGSSDTSAIWSVNTEEEYGEEKK
jgi:protoporphyrinogen oxidase